ncbi:MAG: NYN domain-containing protein [Planctomycetota bacterium]|jgi:uncharacterized protein (TIGR00288 family)
MEEEHRLAVFVDFENLALGFEQGKSKKRFEIDRVLRRLLEKGKVLIKRAYGDWVRYKLYKAELHEAAFELIDLPKRSRVGKNSGDIRICVDAMDLAYSKEHIDTFAIVSGDSDFSPLVSTLKANGKRVIGLGAKASTSELLIHNCDEFIYYEDLERAEEQAPQVPTGEPKGKREALKLLVSAIGALQRENRTVVQASLIKDTMRRLKPQFEEGYHGYKSFTDMLDHAERLGLVRMKEDPRSGTFLVSVGSAKKN